MKNKYKKMFNFLNVKPASEKLTPNNLYDFTIKKEYKKNQETIFWSVFISYMVFYFTRKQWSVVGSQFMEDGIIKSGQYALIGLVFAIAYGVTKFLSSPLSDTKSNKWLLSIGLMGAGVFNLAIGFCWTNTSNIIAPIVLSCVLMVPLGWMHSFGAIPSTRFFYNWFPHKARRNRITVWNVSHNLGAVLATFIVIGSYSLFGSDMGYLAYFILPSIISIVIGIGVLFIIKDSPEVVGLPKLNEYYKMEAIGLKQNLKKEVSQTTINEDDKSWGYFFVKYILKNKYIWLLAISVMMLYAVRMGISDWSLKYLKEVHNYDLKKQGKWIYSMFDWGGLAFTLIIGLLANKYLKRFVPLILILFGATVFALIGMWLLSGGDNPEVALSIFMLIAGVIYIPQFLLPIIATEVAHAKVISTASGLLGIMSYAGDVIMSKVVIGYGLINVSWTAVFIFLIVCGVIGMLVLLPMIKIKSIQ